MLTFTSNASYNPQIESFNFIKSKTLAAAQARIIYSLWNNLVLVLYHQRPKNI